MTEQDRTPDTADDDTAGHGRYTPGGSEHQDEDDAAGHGRYLPGESEREDDNPDDDTAGHGGRADSLACRPTRAFTPRFETDVPPGSRCPRGGGMHVVVLGQAGPAGRRGRVPLPRRPGSELPGPTAAPGLTQVGGGCATLANPDIAGDDRLGPRWSGREVGRLQMQFSTTPGVR
jgi:hypothetical protein